MGSFDPVEAYRLLKPDGLFITQQVGARNDRDLVEMQSILDKDGVIEGTIHRYIIVANK